ncbi:hypothetical protein [Polyangium sp. 6x1]|uniref:hypothetical protein n=1 Tax=Polyangium sp. 6x1 TaxID=3042689 RepID=UPI00248255EB|nr:hypothetical protein [Polyangium sp. 6x1]MDI1442711.1 hypothetical protein [Polyangium sp. 6x1]
MKTNIAFASLIAALAPLASACADATPIDVVPAEAMALSALSAPSSAEGAKAPETHAKKGPGHNLLFPRQAHPFGASYEDWAAAWWQWALSIPVDENPMLDGPCELHQSGNVFFLAGTMGGTATRNCTIPVGKGIFFPIVNVVYRSCPEYVNGSYTCELATSDDKLHEWASSYIESGEGTMLLEIDGVSVANLDPYRAHSEVFADASPLNVEDRVAPACSGPIEANSCGVPVGSPRSSVADGYWAMLHPLPPGQHEIRFAASIDNNVGSFSLDVTYHIVVAP